jgi:hypothetical protein
MPSILGGDPGSLAVVTMPGNRWDTIR